MFNRIAKRLWGDQSGFIVSTDLILVCVILVIGLIVGLTTFRDQLVQEFGDMAMAVGNMNQSYSFSGYTATFGSFTFTVGGSNFTDTSDFCENGGATENNTDPAGDEPAGISVAVAATTESGT